MLIEMYAFNGDVVTYYSDNQARESRLAAATQRKNVTALARMLGYRLHGAQAATAEVRFKLLGPAAADVVIPAGTGVRTQEVTEPVRFQLLADVLIPAGAEPGEAMGDAESSQTRTQHHDARGLPDDVALDQTPHLDGYPLRPGFTALRDLRDRLASAASPLPHLSMGMIADFTVVIDCGATLVPIGTAIFASARRPDPGTGGVAGRVIARVPFRGTRRVHHRSPAKPATTTWRPRSKRPRCCERAWQRLFAPVPSTS